MYSSRSSQSSLQPNFQPATSSSDTPSASLRPAQPQTGVLVAGAIAVDLACDFAPPSAPNPSSASPQLHTSNPAIITQSLGGVGYNVAKAIRYLDRPVRFCTMIGDDLSGHAALSNLVEQGFSSEDVRVMKSVDGAGKSSGRTAQYVAVNDGNKDLVMAMADMNVFERAFSTGAEFDKAWGHNLQSAKPDLVVVDTNWAPSTIYQWLAAAKAMGAITALEPVSVAKASRFISFVAGSNSPKSDLIFPTFPNALIDITTPNALELSAIHSAARLSGLLDTAEWWRIIDALGISSAGARTGLVQLMPARLVDQGIPQQAIQLLPFMPRILTKLGAEGVLLTELLATEDARLNTAEGSKFVLSRSNMSDVGVGGVYMRYFPSSEVLGGDEIVSVNGVGDTFLGTIIAGLAKMKSSGRLEQLIPVAQRAAILTLKSSESASPELQSLAKLL